MFLLNQKWAFFFSSKVLLILWRGGKRDQTISKAVEVGLTLRDLSLKYEILNLTNFFFLVLQKKPSQCILDILAKSEEVKMRKKK